MDRELQHARWRYDYDTLVGPEGDTSLQVSYQFRVDHQSLEKQTHWGPDAARNQSPNQNQKEDVEQQTLDLADLLGGRVELAWVGDERCRHCAEPLRVNQSDGAYAGRNRHFCFRCAQDLARCDLCFVSPEKCHFHLSTCREPEWATSACMVPHTVYLANTSGPKVGITRTGREYARWIDQGASCATAILHTPSRRAAGWVESYFKRKLNDKTDWRGLVSRPPRDYDLRLLAQQLRRDDPELHRPKDAGIDAQEWAQVVWLEPELVRVEYPKLGLSPARRMRLSSTEPMVSGIIQGAIGSYLLLTDGVVNMSEQQSLHVRTGKHMGRVDNKRAATAGDSAGGDEQLDLF